MDVTGSIHKNQPRDGPVKYVHIFVQFLRVMVMIQQKGGKDKQVKVANRCTSITGSFSC